MMRNLDFFFLVQKSHCLLLIPWHYLKTWTTRWFETDGFRWDRPGREWQAHDGLGWRVSTRFNSQHSNKSPPGQGKRDFSLFGSLWTRNALWQFSELLFARCESSNHVITGAAARKACVCERQQNWENWVYVWEAKNWQTTSVGGKYWVSTHQVSRNIFPLLLLWSVRSHGESFFSLQVLEDFMQLGLFPPSLLGKSWWLSFLFFVEAFRSDILISIVPPGTHTTGDFLNWRNFPPFHNDCGLVLRIRQSGMGLKIKKVESVCAYESPST